jgi:hypothetical protein
VLVDGLGGLGSDAGGEVRDGSVVTLVWSLQTFLRKGVVGSTGSEGISVALVSMTGGVVMVFMMLSSTGCWGVSPSFREYVE